MNTYSLSNVSCTRKTFFKVADSDFFSVNSVIENFFILKQCIIQLHNFRKSNKNTMVLGTNGGRSKRATVFMHFCIECNGKLLKFDTIAKIKATFMLEIFVSLRYVMYIHMICEK